MVECELLSACPFFQQEMEYMPATQNLMKKNYCKGDNTKCARYMVYKKLGIDYVPIDLYPNDLKKAKEIISNS